MDRAPHASLIALLGVLPGCTHAGTSEAERAPAKAVPAPDEPGPASDASSTTVPPAPAAGPELPADVRAAKATLLRFREHDQAALASARATLDAFEAPQRYEEHGEVEGKPYYYAREVYAAVGLVVHHDGTRITNVEPTNPGP